ncbi:uncharacterized protein LOC143197195 [Rhynchophorus ferrugineus]|uniref:uncharacterized protein LOC143197195 n=1 Tax=Rhynchophorus ferrugineus TaxID=354439 RepID=UPI003FCD6623
MSVDKKETVTAFQACTGIEDVLLAILYLEDAKWDLSAAIQRMVLPEYKVFPKRPLKPRNKLPVNPNPIDPTRIVKYKQVALKPIRCRYLKFVVSFEDKVIRFKMPDCSNFCKYFLLNFIWFSLFILIILT